MDEPTFSMPPAASLPAMWRHSARWLALAAATVLGTAVAAPTNVAGGSRDNNSSGAAMDALQPGLAGKVRQLALDGSRHAPTGVRRVEVALGQLDARLRLAPCQRIEPYLPPGTALWGKSRIGLRCTQGGTAWNVYLPVTVSAFGTAWVAAAPLSAGASLAAGDLVQAEVNLAEEPAMPITDADQALGRTLARALKPGQALRPTDLKTRQWFSAGDEVKVSARGSGFNVAGSGQALNHGLEGQPVRVRVESGRVLVGMPVGERLVELPL